jgi:hypothetical protein
MTPCSIIASRTDSLSFAAMNDSSESYGLGPDRARSGRRAWASALNRNVRDYVLPANKLGREV